MDMELLGTVAESDSKKMIVRGGSLPETGDSVFDSRKRKVGTVRRVFGPVDSPYVSVTLSGGYEAPVGVEMYYSKETKYGKGKRRA